jgi:hypothetical protein
MQAQQVFRPYGTWNGLRALYPALKRWGIFTGLESFDFEFPSIRMKFNDSTIP